MGERENAGATFAARSELLVDAAVAVAERRAGGCSSSSSSQYFNFGTAPAEASSIGSWPRTFGRSSSARSRSKHSERAERVARPTSERASKQPGGQANRKSVGENVAAFIRLPDLDTNRRVDGWMDPRTNGRTHRPPSATTAAAADLTVPLRMNRWTHGQTNQAAETSSLEHLF